jgi:hypothetical protein
MANSCPCELDVNETPSIQNTDSSTNQLVDDDTTTEEYLEQLANSVPSTNKYQDIANLYPSFHQSKSLATSRKRFKRPSWATVGKRSAILIKKRPSWAQVG